MDPKAWHTLQFANNVITMSRRSLYDMCITDMFYVYMLLILNIIYVNMLSYTGYTYILIYTYQVMYVLYIIHNICTPIYVYTHTHKCTQILNFMTQHMIFFLHSFVKSGDL